MSELPNDIPVQQIRDDEKVPAGAEEAVAEGLTGDDSVPLELRIQGSEDPDRDPAQTDNWGAFTFEPEPGQAMAPPEEFVNPPGIGRGDCKDESNPAAVAGDCDLETTAQVSDLVAEETKPGAGIPGYEGEEPGGT